MAVLGDGKLSGESAQCHLLEFGHHPIEPLTGEPAAAQCYTEIGPIQDLRARCRQRWCDSRDLAIFDGYARRGPGRLANTS